MKLILAVSIVTPKIKDAGWEMHPRGITEQYTFTDGRVEFKGSRVKRGDQKRADYLLKYTRDFAIAVVEAKPESVPVGQGMQQAKDYAEILGLKFAYATNGHEILEFDYTGVWLKFIWVGKTPVDVKF